MSNVLQNAIIMGILLVLILIPVFIIGRQAKRKRRENMKLKLHSLAQNNHLNITKSVFLAHKAIGLDEEKKVLLFADMLSDTQLIIDLSQVTSATIAQTKHAGSIRNVSLNLTGKDGKLFNIPFFESRADNEMQLKSLIQKAEHWQQEVSGLITD